MKDILDSINYDQDNVFRFLLLILKFANDKDVGQFLENVKEGLLDREPCVLYNFDLCNKEILLQYFYGFKLSGANSCQDILYLHLLLMSMCYFTNECYSNKRGKKAEEELKAGRKFLFRVNFDKLHLVYKKIGKIVEYKGVTFEDMEYLAFPKKSEFEEIFHILVEHYKTYKYYYYIAPELEQPEQKTAYVAKISLDKNNDFDKDNSIYPIEEKETVSWLIDTKTGIEYNMHRNLSKFYNKGKAQYERGIKEYKGAHKNIVTNFTEKS